MIVASLASSTAVNPCSSTMGSSDFLSSESSLCLEYKKMVALRQDVTHFQLMFARFLAWTETFKLLIRITY